MGKKITIEITSWDTSADQFDGTKVHTQELRYRKGADMSQEDFEAGMHQQAASSLHGISTNGFIAFNEDKNQFFLIRGCDIVTATATISDTIDIAE